VIHENPTCERFINSIYDCEYKAFFESLCSVYDQVAADRYLSVHRDWFVREMRVLAYRQFLESYKSVTLKSMATSFGVSITFLDGELAHFISAGRLNAKIDKTSGVIETNRPLHSNAQYQEVIKQGDLLLNRVQMLSRAINV
jgi:26S proteasome regulatory subunit N7